MPTGLRIRGSLALLLSLSVAACQGSGAVQATPSPSRVASPAATATSAPGASAAPSIGVDGAWIAYQWIRGGGDGIYLARPDGTNPHELLPDATYNAFHPDWSSDGAKIAFDAETGGGHEIWVVNADGTNAAAIVPRSTDCAISCGDVAEPAWSPDSSKIAFVRFQLGASGLEAAVIEVQHVAGGDRQVLFRAPSKTALDDPRWSSDGQSIVFTMTRYPDTQITAGTATGSAIAVIAATGEGAKPDILTDWSMYATYPDWQRHGSEEIVFSTYDLEVFQATDEPSNLYSINPDGTGLKILTTFGKAEQRATQPTWTPNGSQIIFTLVGQQAGMDNPRQSAFIQGAGGANIVNIGVAATHPRLRPGTP
jgi:Tol biopolymer transport system component